MNLLLLSITSLTANFTCFYFWFYFNTVKLYIYQIFKNDPA